MLGVRIPAATNLSCKTGIDSSTAKRSAIGRVPRVLGDDQHTKMPGVTVGVAAPKNLQWTTAMNADIYWTLVILPSYHQANKTKQNR